MQEAYQLYRRQNFNNRKKTEKKKLESNNIVKGERNESSNRNDRSLERRGWLRDGQPRGTQSWKADDQSVVFVKFRALPSQEK